MSISKLLILIESKTVRLSLRDCNCSTYSCAVSASTLLSSLQSKSKKDSMEYAVLTELNFNVTDVNLDEGLKNHHSKMEYLRTNF